MATGEHILTIKRITAKHIPPNREFYGGSCECGWIFSPRTLASTRDEIRIAHAAHLDAVVAVQTEANDATGA